MKRFNRLLAGVMGIGLALVLVSSSPGAARAEILAAWAQGHGGMSSSDGESVAGGPDASVSAPGLGFQLGARVLIFEGYLDRTAFGDGENVSRGILGLRVGLGVGGLRLVLRGGGGVINEEGGALTGPYLGVPDRTGVVARAGVSLEKKLAPMLWGGFGVDGEYFSLAAAGSDVTTNRIDGSDIFASLRLLFELGI